MTTTPGEAASGGAPTVRDAATARRRSSRTPAPPEPREIALLRALSDAARDMHRSLSLAEVVRVATERAREIVGAEEAATTQVADADWSNAITVTATVDDRPARHVRIPSADVGGPEREVCRTNRPLRLAWVDLARDGGRLSQASKGSGSWLGAPLVGSDGRNLGLIQVAGKTPVLDDGPETPGDAEFTAGDEAVLLQLARMASVAIENARLYQAALDTRSQLAWAAHVERVRAAELTAVINAMGEAVLVCDAAGQVDFANVAADALFAGRPVATFDDLLSRFRVREGEAIDADSSPMEVSLRDAPDRWVELRIYPVASVVRQTGEKEMATGRIAVLRDITPARQARAQREAFLGILSHELRTPITTIYAGSKVLARDEGMVSETSRELASDISAEAERLFRLVEDLLVMTRAERGVLQLGHEPVLLQRVASVSIRLESAHWPATRIRLEEPVDLPAVIGDATYVEQVVRNLLSNAAKYSPPQGEVEVRLEPADGEVICRVLDRGRGFQSGETEDLFDLFYRSPATAAQAAGAGIGLFVCRRLVTGMGGRIWARPRTGGGAEFGFALKTYDEG
jgi:signal transduction histidine kinase